MKCGVLQQKQVSTGPRPDEGRLSTKVNPMTPQPPTPHMMGLFTDCLMYNILRLVIGLQSKW